MIYDRFQNEAIEYINQGHSVIVSAPTGAGKTAIAEHVIETCLKTNKACIYTAPIKALSNQKFRDFQGQYADSIGILTGDVSLNADAPVLIMTTEIFRNKILENPKALERYSWVIFDEIHYIDNQERGTVWEESLIFMPVHMNILCLSATIPNITQFAKWIESIHKKEIKVIIEARRPVPLHFRYQVQNRVVDSLHDIRKHHGRFQPNKIHSLIKYLRQNDGLPCIYFVFSRKRTEYLAAELYNYEFLSEEEKVKISASFSSLLDKFDLKHEKSAIAMQPLIERGIAYHHAGMLPTLKEVIERLFTSRLLKVIFTTETFALGINMPSRSVVFDELVKFYGTYVRALKTRDFYQMAGRAGRRGMDTEGFVYVRLVPTQVTLDEVQYSLFGQPEPVISQFNASYATTLNLYEHYGERVLDLYPRTLHCFQASKRARKLARQRLVDRLNVLKASGCIRHEKLTNKGNFARYMFGYELYLAHLFEEGLLDRFAPHELAFALACLVFEPRPGVQLPRSLPPQFTWVARELTRTFHTIHAVEVSHDIEPGAPPPKPQ